jgi:hypothetical protein
MRRQSLRSHFLEKERIVADTMAMSTPALEDARTLFDNYVNTTKHILRCTGDVEPYIYPPGANELDMIALATVFSNVWQAIGNDKDFKTHYQGKPDAFRHLQCITEPDTNRKPKSWHPYNAFWRQDPSAPAKLVPIEVTKEEGMHALGRTLRNGFNHFNYRWVNDKPTQYFKRLAKPMPAALRDHTTDYNYRIFIIDHWTWNRKLKKAVMFMDPDSDTRILETHFGHIRFHLYYFLDLFFQAEGAPPALELLGLGKGVHARDHV